MKKIDFENGTVTNHILSAALPMLVAQLLNLLYNIVDRIYIARIPDVGTVALGAVGLCFPIIVIITAFSNLFGHRRGAAVCHQPGTGGCEKGGSDHEHGVYHGVRGGAASDGDRNAVCQTAAVSVWRRPRTASSMRTRI